MCDKYGNVLAHFTLSTTFPDKIECYSQQPDTTANRLVNKFVLLNCLFSFSTESTIHRYYEATTILQIIIFVYPVM